MDAATILARNMVNIGYGDIPAEALEITRKQILDMLAVTIGGSTASGCLEVIELIKDWGGKEESTIFAHGIKVPAHHAALVNATMCDALDYDDTNDYSGAHSGTTVIPACFAVAERKGRVNGKAFLTAVALGVDLVHRMGLATRLIAKPRVDYFTAGWEFSPLYGFFGCAAAAGKILEFDEKKTVNALGIAYAQASGNIQCIHDGALTKRLQNGFAAKGGVLSALMAEKGITGAQNSLEGINGLYNVYHRGDYDPNILTADLGKRFEGLNVCFKPYPCCRLNHAPLDATLGLLKDHALKPEDIAEVTLYLMKKQYALCEPLEAKRNPKNIVDAQFSIPWNVACAIVRGMVTIGDFTPDALKDRAILQMAQKINPKLDDDLTLPAGGDVGALAMVKIKTNDGRVLSKRVDFPYGSVQNPMSWDSIVDKLRECAPYAAKPIPEENLEKVAELVWRLEEVDNVNSIIRLLS